MAQQRTIDRIYTDGGCIRNPGPGGWGVVIQFTDGTVLEMGDRQPETTNNRMELMGAIQALEALKRPSKVALHTDSTYVREIVDFVMGDTDRSFLTPGG